VISQRDFFLTKIQAVLIEAVKSSTKIHFSSNSTVVISEKEIVRNGELSLLHQPFSQKLVHKINRINLFESSHQNSSSLDFCLISFSL